MGKQIEFSAESNQFDKNQLNYSLAAHLQDNSRSKSPTKVDKKRTLQQVTVSGWLITSGGASDSEKRKL